MGLQFYLYLVLLVQLPILQDQVLDLEGQLLYESILIHLVLVQDGDTTRVAVVLDDHFDGLTLHLSLLYLGCLFIAQLLQLF